MSVACPWTSTSYVALATSGVRWRIEQAEEFREHVEHDTDDERVILADAYQALLRYGPLPIRPPRWGSTGSAIRAPETPTRWSCRRSWSAIRCSATPSWCKQPTSSAARSCSTAQRRDPRWYSTVAYMWQSSASRAGHGGNKPSGPIRC